MSDQALLPGPKVCESSGPTPSQDTSNRGRALAVGRGVSIYYQQLAPSRWTEHTHRQVQIVLAIEPVDAVISWRVRDERERCGVTGRFVWLLPADAPHAADWHGEASLVVLLVEPAFVRDVCEADFATAWIEDFPTLARFNLRVWHLVEDFQRLCHREGPAAALMIESVGTLLAAQVLSYFASKQGATGRGLPAHKLRTVLDHIDAHLREPVTRTTLARLAHLSVRCFGRQFKVTTGLAPGDYIRRRRTVRALELLAEGQLKRAAIASEVGFYDQSHMQRHLRRFREEADRTTVASR